MKLDAMKYKLLVSLYVHIAFILVFYFSSHSHQATVCLFCFLLRKQFKWVVMTSYAHFTYFGNQIKKKKQYCSVLLLQVLNLNLCISLYRALCKCICVGG